MKIKRKKNGRSITMKALVVYDSMFGNTEQVAQAMATALADTMEVTARRVGDVTPDDLMAVALLIVGSPTQGFRPTPAVKTLLDSVPAQGLNGVKVAAFDTRIAVEDVGNRFLTFMVRLFGYAAKPLANHLEKKGGDLVMPPEGFIVNGKEGPLKEGELERAATWATAVGRMGTPAAESLSVH
jgi:flavodoxin